MRSCSAREHAEGVAALLSAGGRVVSEPDWGSYDLALDGSSESVAVQGCRETEPQPAVHALDCPIVAVDAPSGIGVDSAELHGPHVSADLTVTFGTHKIGLLADPAAQAAGVVEWSTSGSVRISATPSSRLFRPTTWRTSCRCPNMGAHKYSRGVLGIAAGSQEYVGAGLLATSGRRRSRGSPGWCATRAPAKTSSDYAIPRS